MRGLTFPIAHVAYWREIHATGDHSRMTSRQSDMFSGTPFRRFLGAIEARAEGGSGIGDEICPLHYDVSNHRLRDSFN